MDSRQPSEKDRNLFGLIAHDIRVHQDDYHAAGKWLDEYCSEQAHWGRRQAELEEMKRDLRGVLAMDDRITALEEEIRERRPPAQLVRFEQARTSLLDENEKRVLLSVEDARRVLIVSWLLTDPDAEKTDLGITEWQKWLWAPADDLTAMSRGVAYSLWAASGAGYEAWVVLAQAAWDRIKLDREASPVPQTSSRKQSLPLDTSFTEGRREAKDRSIVGDTWSVCGFSINWRGAISRFRSLSTWKKLMIGAAVLALVYVTRSLWFPLLHGLIINATTR